MIYMFSLSFYVGACLRDCENIKEYICVVLIVKKVVWELENRQDRDFMVIKFIDMILLTLHRYADKKF